MYASAMGAGRGHLVGAQPASIAGQDVYAITGQAGRGLSKAVAPKSDPRRHRGYERHAYVRTPWWKSRHRHPRPGVGIRGDREDISPPAVSPRAPAKANLTLLRCDPTMSFTEAAAAPRRSLDSAVTQSQGGRKPLMDDAEWYASLPGLTASRAALLTDGAGAVLLVKPWYRGH